ncbi:Deuterolysin [Fusarium keratoplasticum]|uniref:Deuterolysin n=1 Tax=Fusarium keratoplasticum TaxID=1328300 RepID=A0ACC0R767_9HYPO|nr:Deuterolysin [Fusarium keratoplasticum]KAI8675744.1 Deuterolysin [Fusarium keratoplasticum]KAI8682191.1 Deuterolysin [Fusarium keratoplasticum]
MITQTFPIMAILAMLAFLGMAVAAPYSDIGLEIALPDMKTVYPIPLEVVIKRDEKIDSKFEAEVFNHNDETVKVLKFGSFLHDDDVALKVADVFYKGNPVRFLGVTPLLNFDKLDKRQFVTIKTGQSVKIKFNLAEHYDLSQGEDYTVLMQGSLPIADLGSTNIIGYIPYSSNSLRFTVDRRVAEQTRMKYLNRMPRVQRQNCKGERIEKLRESLSQCFQLADEAEEEARFGDSWRLEEAFGASDEKTRSRVAEVFAEAKDKCKHDFRKVDKICPEYYSECLSRKKIVTAYIQEPTRQVGYCDNFFTLPVMPEKCHGYDSSEAWGWHPSRAGAVIHEMIQLNLRDTMGVNATLDTEHGLAKILALSPELSVTNADNYDLFASHVSLNCEAISPARRGLDHLRTKTDKVLRKDREAGLWVD